MGRKSILLVDDERLILESLARELTSASRGFDVAIASSGEEAVAKLNDRFWNLVVTDLVMPGLDGLQVLHAAKQANIRTMVIVLTGYANLESAIDALRLGADDFLQKPCDVEELLYRMDNCFTKQDLLVKVSFYESILPVCCYCKKIRDDLGEEQGQGNWYSPEQYFIKVKGVKISHGCCPECFKQHMAEIESS